MTYINQFQSGYGQPGTNQWDRQTMEWLKGRPADHVDSVVDQVVETAYQDANGSIRQAESNWDRSGEARNMGRALNFLGRYRLNRALADTDPAGFNGALNTIKEEANSFQRAIDNNETLTLVGAGQLHRVDFRDLSNVAEYVHQNNRFTQGLAFPPAKGDGAPEITTMEQANDFYASYQYRKQEQGKAGRTFPNQNHFMRESLKEFEHSFSEEMSEAKAQHNMGARPDTSTEMQERFRRINLLAHAADHITRYPEPVDEISGGTHFPEMSERQLKEQLLEFSHNTISHPEAEYGAHTVYEIYAERAKRQVASYTFSNDKELVSTWAAIRSSDQRAANALEQLAHPGTSDLNPGREVADPMLLKSSMSGLREQALNGLQAAQAQRVNYPNRPAPDTEQLELMAQATEAGMTCQAQGDEDQALRYARLAREIDYLDPAQGDPVWGQVRMELAHRTLEALNESAGTHDPEYLALLERTGIQWRNSAQEAQVSGANQADAGNANQGEETKADTPRVNMPPAEAILR